MSNWVDCTGDVVAGDTIKFDETVRVDGAANRWRTVTGKVIRDKYGEETQQHRFVIEVIESTGFDPLPAGKRIVRRGRWLYANGVLRQPWTNKNERKAALKEKHTRGDTARQHRAFRREMGEFFQAGSDWIDPNFEPMRTADEMSELENRERIDAMRQRLAR